MTELNRANCFTVILNCYLFLVLLTYFQETHINEGFKKYLTFHLIDPDGKFDCESIFTDDLNDFGLIFELFAFILDLGSG